MSVAAETAWGGLGLSAGWKGKRGFSPGHRALQPLFSLGAGLAHVWLRSSLRAAMTFESVAPLSPVLVLSHLVPAIPVNPCWLFNSFNEAEVTLTRQMSLLLNWNQTEPRAVFVLGEAVAKHPTAPHGMLRSSRFALCEGQSLEHFYERVAEWTDFSLDIGFMPKS